MNSYFLCISQPTNLGDLIINRMLILELSKYGNVYVDAYNTPVSFRKELFGKSNIIDMGMCCDFSAKKMQLFRLYKFIKKEDIIW